MVEGMGRYRTTAAWHGNYASVDPKYELRGFNGEWGAKLKRSFAQSWDSIEANRFPLILTMKKQESDIMDGDQFLQKVGWQGIPRSVLR